MLTYGNAPFSKSGRVKGKRSNVAVVGFPSDIGGTTRGGQATGPQHVRTWSVPGAGFYPDTGDMTTISRICDCGDLHPDTRDLESYLEDVRNAVSSIARNTKLLLALCGDDSITYGVGMGLHDVYPELAVVHYDAHVDMYGEDDESIDHANWVGYLKGETNVPILQRGCRAPTEYEPLSDDIEDRPLLIAIDIDVIDPAYAPGVSCPYPLGVEPQELLEDVFELVWKNQVVGISVSEVNADRDVRNMTGMLVPAIINRILSRIYN